ncbi:unnamed protein product, partial [Chrysoparadoxa australica]
DGVISHVVSRLEGRKAANRGATLVRSQVARPTSQRLLTTSKPRASGSKRLCIRLRWFTSGNNGKRLVLVRFNRWTQETTHPTLPMPLHLHHGACVYCGHAPSSQLVYVWRVSMGQRLIKAVSDRAAGLFCSFHAHAINMNTPIRLPNYPELSRNLDQKK